MNLVPQGYRNSWTQWIMFVLSLSLLVKKKTKNTSCSAEGKIWKHNFITNMSCMLCDFWLEGGYWRSEVTWRRKLHPGLVLFTSSLLFTPELVIQSPRCLCNGWAELRPEGTRPISRLPEQWATLDECNWWFVRQSQWCKLWRGGTIAVHREQQGGSLLLLAVVGTTCFPSCIRECRTTSARDVVVGRRGITRSHILLWFSMWGGGGWGRGNSLDVGPGWWCDTLGLSRWDQVLAGTSTVWFGPLFNGAWDGTLSTRCRFWSVVALLLLPVLLALRLPTESWKKKE